MINTNLSRKTVEKKEVRAINPKGIAGSFQIMYRLDLRISRKFEKISIQGRDITGLMNLFYLHD